MKTITTMAEIASDGTLRLELPTGLSPGSAEIVIVVQPTPARPSASGPSLLGKYEKIARPDFDAVAEVRELRRRATGAAQEIPE